MFLCSTTEEDGGQTRLSPGGSGAGCVPLQQALSLREQKANHLSRRVFQCLFSLIPSVPSRLTPRSPPVRSCAHPAPGGSWSPRHLQGIAGGKLVPWDCHKDRALGCSPQTSEGAGQALGLWLFRGLGASASDGGVE